MGQNAYSSVIETSCGDGTRRFFVMMQELKEIDREVDMTKR